jgi:hypothetical protein
MMRSALPPPEPESWAKPQRGIIVLDTSALFNLSAPMQAEDGRKRLFSVLPFLAKNGFTIVVPEMVAFEACESLSGGEWVGRYFPTSNQKPLKMCIADFLRHASIENSIHIAPPHREDSSTPAEFIRCIKRVYDADTRDEQKREGIIAARRVYGPLKNFGDFAANELVRSLDARDLPVFYVSDDSKALKSVAAVRDGVHPLTTLGFIRPLADNRILSALQFMETHIYWIGKAIRAHFKANDLGFGLLSAGLRTSIESETAFANILAGIDTPSRGPVRKPAREWPPARKVVLMKASPT